MTEFKEVGRDGMSIGEWKIGDRKKLLSLINQVQPDIPWNRAYFDWQYLDNPAGQARIWVAKDREVIVAAYAAIPHYMRCGGSISIGWRIQDVLTHRNYRGRGLMHQLAKQCRDAICTTDNILNFTFPNERSHMSFVRNQWSPVFQLPLRVASCNRKDSTGCGSDVKVRMLDDFGDEINILWEEAAANFFAATQRDCSYLHWRYLAKPDTTYFPFVAFVNSRAVGLLVMKYYDHPDSTRTAHICELFVGWNQEEIVESLLHQARRFAEDVGAETLSAWLPCGHLYESFYHDQGLFLGQERSRWLVISHSVLETNRQLVNDPTVWHLSMGDVDIY